MEEQFVPEGLALKLKELGFDELCLSRFYGGGFIMLPAHDPLRNSEIKEHWFCTAPLWQQAFDWFRNNGLYSWINKSFSCYNINIVRYDNMEDCNVEVIEGLSFKDFNTYKEARLACLEKLIQILEDGKRNS